MSPMMQRYLIERRKACANDFYTLGICEGHTMRDVAAKIVGDFAAGDSIRITLLSVVLTATLNSEATWDVHHERL